MTDLSTKTVEELRDILYYNGFQGGQKIFRAVLDELERRLANARNDALEKAAEAVIAVLRDVSEDELVIGIVERTIRALKDQKP